MKSRQLNIQGSYVIEPGLFSDERGSFHETFKLSKIAETFGLDFHVRQVNQSVSKKGVVRGIHWADVPPGQAKYISCPKGSLLDFVVDLRVGSPTFGEWDSVLISQDNNCSVLISSGLGHAFIALEDDTVASYLCSEEFNQKTERGICPTDTEVGIPWLEIAEPFGVDVLILSEKDAKAPSLQTMLDEGQLPDLSLL